MHRRRRTNPSGAEGGRMKRGAYAATPYPSPLWGGWRAASAASRVGVAAFALGPLPPPPDRSHSLAATLPTRGRGKENMTALTSLTLAEARDGLRTKKFSARELTDAHLAAMEQARGAQRLRAGDAGAARAPWRARVDAAHRQGRGAARWKAFRSAIKDLFCTEGRAHHGVLATSSTTSRRPTNRP